MRAPSAWNFLGFSRNSLISCSSSTASSTPATSRKVIFGESTDIRLARDLPNDMTFEPPPWTWFIRKIQKPMKIRNGRTYVSSERITLERAGLTSKSVILPSAVAVRSLLTRTSE